MSAAQFRTAGLDKLSPEELAALNAWLQQNLDMPQAVAPMPYGSGRGAPGGDGGTVRSRLIGEFRGWSGKTTFQLENGQVWQQTNNETWSGVKLDSPGITIEPGFMGSHLLKVEGYNASTKVKRIR
ncbi:hypothetical protein OS176_12735 [Xanthomonadaceae bacterium XH05]|nr:hypothetical protein [Xanthomonadaceae bacterium XH05]